MNERVIAFVCCSSRVFLANTLIFSILLYYYPMIQYQNVGDIPNSAFQQNQIIHGRVEKVIDGDTIRVRYDRRQNQSTNER